MSSTVFKDANLSDAQVNQNYTLKQVKNVNDAAATRLAVLEAQIAVPSDDSFPDGAFVTLNKRFTLNVGGIDYYIYGIVKP